ncbi:MAG: hypothetical protein PHW03_09815 [Eubacteriales bacterium]|nr:hypothetical protein [Eubacteriales bacterium]
MDFASVSDFLLYGFGSAGAVVVSTWAIGCVWSVFTYIVTKS